MAITRIRSVHTGDLLHAPKCDGDYFKSLAFSPDPALLVTGEEEVVRIWRVDMGDCLHGNQRLLSDFGAISLRIGSPNGPFPKVMPEYWSGHCRCSESSWATWNGENPLWLPVDFRPQCSAISGSTVLLGCTSGRVVVIRFSSQKLPRQITSPVTPIHSPCMFSNQTRGYLLEHILNTKFRSRVRFLMTLLRRNTKAVLFEIVPPLWAC